MEKKRVAIILAMITVVVVVVAILASYKLVFERPIKASAEEVILNENDLPGWSENYSKIDHGDMDTVWYAFSQYYNSSTEVGQLLSIQILSESSSAVAHDDYQGIWNLIPPDSSTLKMGDEGVVFTTHEYAIISNETIQLDEEKQVMVISTWYVFREANVYVNMCFVTIGHPWDPNASYRQEWMDHLVQMQVDKVHQNNIHIL